VFVLPTAEPRAAVDSRATPAPTLLDAAQLAEAIDRHVAAQWAAEKAEPAPAADDAEFMRRVYLDIAGKIPPVSEVREFLDDRSGDKRQRLVDRLLGSALYVRHFSDVWGELWLPDTGGNIQLRALRPSFQSWLRLRLADNAAYDKLVRELLTTPLNNALPFARGVNQAAASPIAFYQANEVKPENLAAASSRLFLGVKLECAQCHNHPFARWTREQFWGFATFFGGIRGSGPNVFGPIQESSNPRGLTIPGTDKTVPARFLDDRPPAWTANRGGRDVLAEWLTSADNPYFARATANRLWAEFFGIGLVEPVDDLDPDNPASHPELLDELARQLAYHQFDLKYLIRAITASRTYGSTSRATHASQDNPRLFARMAVRGMTPEQLYDSLVEATGFRDRAPTSSRLVDFVIPNGPRGEFLARFTERSDKRTEHQTSILQALALMNGRLISDSTSVQRSETLAAMIDAPFLDTAGRIEALYLATLSRPPRPDELSRSLDYVNAQPQAATGLSDVYWALLNSSEFMLNH
jgi:hypothetical protein